MCVWEASYLTIQPLYSQPSNQSVSFKYLSNQSTNQPVTRSENHPQQPVSQFAVQSLSLLSVYQLASHSSNKPYSYSSTLVTHPASELFDKVVRAQSGFPRRVFIPWLTEHVWEDGTAEGREEGEGRKGKVGCVEAERLGRGARVKGVKESESGVMGKRRPV